jgi:hypothetical protein
MCVQMLYVTVEDPGRPAGPPCVPSPSLDDVREERMVRLSAFPNSIGQPSGWIQLDISNRQLSTGNCCSLLLLPRVGLELEPPNNTVGRAGSLHFFFMTRRTTPAQQPKKKKKSRRHTKGNY